MVSTSDFRNGMVIRLDGQLFFMTEFEHFKPGKGAAVVRTKLKSVMSGAVIDRTFRSGDKVDDVRLEKTKEPILVQAGCVLHFYGYPHVRAIRSAYGDCGRCTNAVAGE